MMLRSVVLEPAETGIGRQSKSQFRQGPRFSAVAPSGGQQMVAEYTKLNFVKQGRFWPKQPGTQSDAPNIQKTVQKVDPIVICHFRRSMFDPCPASKIRHQAVSELCLCPLNDGPRLLQSRQVLRVGG
jgi:hypothetical protein